MFDLATPSGENTNFKTGCSTRSAFPKASLPTVAAGRLNQFGSEFQKPSGKGGKSDQSRTLLHTKRMSAGFLKSS